MNFIECPRCRARFRTGIIYESLERCPRCGGRFAAPKLAFPARLRASLRRRVLRDNPDWEAITGSQYLRGGVAGGGEDDGNRPAPA